MSSIVLGILCFALGMLSGIFLIAILSANDNGEEG
jgi:hypothetical protein